GGAAGATAWGPTADLHARAGRCRGPDGPHRPAAVGALVRLLDAGPLGGLSGRAPGPQHEAQSPRRAPPRPRLTLAQTRDVGRRAGRPRGRRNTGAIEHRYPAAPDGSVVVCLDELGPQAAKSIPGHERVDVPTRPAARAKQELDDGRRGTGDASAPSGRP